MPQIFDVTANENAHYKCNELESSLYITTTPPTSFVQNFVSFSENLIDLPYSRQPHPLNPGAIMPWAMIAYQSNQDDWGTEHSDALSHFTDLKLPRTCVYLFICTDFK